MQLDDPDAGVSYADVNGLQVAYETFGDRGHPPVLLITGLATQMLVWPDELCAALAARDLYVIRVDNRDVGLSTHLDAIGPLSLLRVLRRRPPYAISDMAADLAALIEVLAMGPVHIVGASMGGFIGQTMALDRRELVRTLTLIMTSTGSRKVGQPDRTVAVRMALRKPQSDREGAIASAIATFRQIGSPGYPFEEELIRDIAGRCYDRDHRADGRRRQLAAVLAQPDRTARLASLTAPTLVIHGLADRVIHVSGGRALAAAIPGARFIGYEGMGHNLPNPLWPEVVDELATHFKLK